MEDGVDVKFRWFRTVESACESVILVPLDQQWSAVELVWDKQKLLYESLPSFVPCGKHEAYLIIDHEKYPCQTFSIVATTFELNLFLQEETLNESDMAKARVNSSSRQSFTYSPLQVDVTWSPGVYSPIAGFVGDVIEREDHSKPINIYEELLANKDREIEQLRQEIKNLKLLVVKMESDARLSNAHKRIETSQALEMSNELNELQKEKKSLELETRTMLSCIKENEEAKESLEWEVQQLRERLSSNDPSEIMQVLVEMKSLREELRTVCQKNGELIEEVLKLRAENTRLAKESLSQVVQQDSKLGDSLCYSDPESGCTQYKDLPVTAVFSRSLPILGSPERVKVPQRSISVDVGHASPLSSDSLLTEELLSYGSSIKVGSGVQTDITAVHGSPHHYTKQLAHDKGSKAKLHKTSRKKTISKEKKISRHRAKMKSYMEEEDSSDTEELLQEAENFILSAMGSNTEMLTRHAINGDQRHRSKYSTSDNFHSSSFTRHPSNFTRDDSVYRSGTNKQVNVETRPFIPKCALDLKPGHLVRYHGTNGRVNQGKVAFVGCLPEKSGTFVGVGDDELVNSFQSQPPSRTFIPFKKVILAWD